MRCSLKPLLLPLLSPRPPPAVLPPEKQVKKQPSRQRQNLYLLPAILLLHLMSCTSASELVASNHLLEQQQQQQLEQHHHHDHYQQQREPLPESATSPLNSGSNGNRKRKTKVPPSPSITSKVDILMINHVATTAKSLTTTTDNATSNFSIEWPHSSFDINEKKRLAISSKSSQTDIKDRFHTNSTTTALNSNNSVSNHERSSSERRKRQPQDSDRLRINSYINNNNNNAIGPETETLKMGAQLTSSSALTLTTATISHDSTSTAATITTSEDTNSSSSEPLKCRVERNFYLDFEQYKHYTCANCYNMIPKHLFVRKLAHRKDAQRRVWLYDNDTNRQLLPNETETLKATFKNEYNYQKWLICCREAELCCLNNRKHLPKTRNQTGHLIDEEPREKCYATWDGLACWPESSPGLVEQRCRSYVYFLDFEPVCEGYVKKQCFANGSWYNRNDHEWSDFSGCAALTIYATRLLIGSVWHLVSAIVIGPALIVFSKMPNRGGSKRVRILRNLLFWLLVNSLLSASHKIGVIGGFFIQETSPSPPTSTTTSSSSSSSLTSSPLVDPHLPATDNSSQFAATNTQLTTLKEVERNTRSIGSHIPLLDVWNERLDRVKLIYEQLDANLDTANDECDDYSNPHDDQQPGHWQLSAIKSKSKSLIPINGHLDQQQQQQRLETSTSNQRPTPQVAQVDPKFANTPKSTTNDHTLSDSSDKPIARGTSLVYKHPDLQHQLSSSLETDVEVGSDESRTVESYSIDTVSSRSARCKRSTSNNQSKYQKQPPFVIFICWIVSVGIRVTRLLHYAWMFTGAVYLCSILHFAPAEPPSLFIKYLMILTNGFPGVIGIIYIITRTVYEPSPLTLLVKLPFYHLIGDEANIKHLWETQLVCWMSESKHEFIEEIAEFPNLVLIILNAGLFIVTLIIMCRITRPGSTRPEMSLGDYFKAAGTLVLLYGAHYALIAYRPPIEGCIKAQVFYYLFLFVDGIQGIAVSWVFCYRTNEGREITNKWRAAWSRYALRRLGLTSAERSSTRQQSFLGANSKSNQSTRSNNSVCNGKDMATELINIADMQTSASQC